MSRQSIQKIKAMLLCIESGILFVDTVDKKIKASNALNTMFVETVNTTVKTYPHISAHNFLNIQPIFNLKKVFESWDRGLFNHTMLYMSILSIQDKDSKCIQCNLCRHHQNKTHPHIPAHNFLNIQLIFNPNNILES